jgi:hypothetical protein
MISHTIQNKYIMLTLLVAMVACGLTYAVLQAAGPKYHSPLENSNRIILRESDLVAGKKVTFYLPLENRLMIKAGMEARLLRTLSASGERDQAALTLAQAVFETSTARLAIDSDIFESGEEYLLQIRTTHKYFNPYKRFFIKVEES